MNEYSAQWIWIMICVAAMCLSLLTACQTSNMSELLASKRLTPAIRIPESVMRLGVMYPSTRDQELLAAYCRLEEATFQMKQERPLLQIVDCTERDLLREEQRMQLSGSVSDETVSRVGGLLSLDSILLYKIMVPSKNQGSGLAIIHQPAPLP